MGGYASRTLQFPRAQLPRMARFPALSCWQVHEDRSRVHFSTCHKPKGAEFPYVQLADDFMELVRQGDPASRASCTV